MGLTKDNIKLYMAIQEIDGAPRKMEHWHCSSLAQCPKSQYLQRMEVGESSVPSAAKILRWSAGHHMETSIREYMPSLFDKGEVVLSNERMLNKDLDLTGEYDNYAVKAKTLVEIKTVHDYAFIQRDNENYLKENSGEKNERGNIIWDIKQEPYLHHEIQNHAYALMLDLQPNVELRGVERIKYVYISLSGRMVTYETPIKPELIKNVKKRLEVLNKAWKDKVPPECICKEEHPLYAPVMQYCPYKTELGCCLEDNN